MASRPGTDPLADFSVRPFAHSGAQHAVYVGGTGPAVLVLPEMPGITPAVARFARFVIAEGFQVWMPSLFGRPGEPPGRGAALREIVRACAGRQFGAFASTASGPVEEWLRALAVAAHRECGGVGVGVIGMCFTGNFALSMMVEPAVRAPVLAQPSLPLFRPAALHVSAADLSLVKERLDAEDLEVLAYRFEGDPFCPAARFEALGRALGPRCRRTTLPRASANPAAPRPAHSVVTEHLVDRAGEPTRAAVDEILAFFRLRLLPAAGGDAGTAIRPC